MAGNIRCSQLCLSPADCETSELLSKLSSIRPVFYIGIFPTSKAILDWNVCQDDLQSGVDLVCPLELDENLTWCRLVFLPLFGTATVIFNTYPGYGEVLTETYHYSQSVRIGDFIECAGQGGWYLPLMLAL